MHKFYFFFNKLVYRASGKSSKDGSTSSSTSDSSSSSSSGTESEDESDIESEETKKDNVVAENHIKAPEVKESKSNLDLLLDLDISDTVAPVMTPSLGGFLTPITTANQVLATTPSIQIVSPAFYPVKEIELLDRISGRGLGITYKYTRNPHLFSPNMVNINLSFKNTLSEDITDIRIGKKVHIFYQILKLYFNSVFSRIYHRACLYMISLP